MLKSLFKSHTKPAKTENRKDLLLSSSDVFCMAPWVHLHANIEGKIFPCCNAAGYLDEAIGDLKQNPSLLSAWNSERMKTLRQNMLSGKRSAMCGQCYKYEQIGNNSARLQMNTEFAGHADKIDMTGEDGYLNTNAIPYLDIRFSNFCNFTCRICSHYFSNKWYNEAVALGTVAHNGDRVTFTTNNPEQLWKELEQVLPYVEKIHFAGGEPLMTEEHYRILEFLLQQGKTDVLLTYNTNFSHLTFKGYDAVKYWAKFSNVYLGASLDGSGTRAEFMRKGQVWSEAVANRQRLLAECPNVKFYINPAVSLLNIWHLPDFYKEWVEAGLLEPQNIDAYLVFDPAYYDVQRLPADIKKVITEKYSTFINNYLHAKGADDNTKRKLKYLVDYMNEQQLPMLDEFYTVTAKLDNLRGEEFYSIFPELEGLKNKPTV